MAKTSLFVVTMPATLTVVVEAASEKDAKETAATTAELVFGKSLGVLTVVGDVKVQPVAAGKVSKKSKADDDEEEEDEEEEADDEEEEDEEEDDEEEEDEDEEEEEAPKKKKSSDKGDKKADGKKKIKIKLKG